MPRRPVIGITLEFEDNLILEVEKGLRAPLQEEGALVISLPRTRRCTSSIRCSR